MKFPELTTERLLLRATEGSDAAAVYSIFSDTDVMRYYGMAPIVSMEQASRIIESHGKLYASGNGIR